jgi:hypothetical protein
MACRSAWLSDRTEPLGRSSSSKGRGREQAIGCSFLVVLAGGPLRAWPATLLARSRLAGAFAGRLALVGAAVAGPLLGLGALDGRTDPLVGGPLAEVVGLGAERPVRIRDLVDAPVLLVSAAAWRQTRQPRVDAGTDPSISRT